MKKNGLFGDSIARYNIKNGSLFNGNGEPVKHLYWGQVTTFDDSVDSSLLYSSDDIEENIHLFNNSFGNFVKIFVTAKGLCILTTAYKMVYIHQSEEDVWIYENLKQLEDKVAEVNQIDFDSIFYYVASGNMPAMELTFFRNIQKVDGVHCYQIKEDGSVSNKDYSIDFDRSSISRDQYFSEYSKIMDKEAKGWKDYFKSIKVKPCVAISGVDSFNSVLALGVENVQMVHVNVHERQQKYVSAFVDECRKKFPNVDYEELDRSSFTDSIESVCDVYKDHIRPYVKYSTGTPIEQFTKSLGGEFYVSGDLCGLTMAYKSYTSTLKQNSFYGRYFHGMKKRFMVSRYMTRNLNRYKIDKTRKVRDMYYFMTSLLVPTKGFNEKKPWVGLKQASGLDKHELKLYLKYVDRMMCSFEKSTGWSREQKYENLDYWRQVHHQAFYQTAPAMRDIKILSLFSSTYAYRFNPNYHTQIWGDIIGAKKIVYDYFYEKMGITIKEMAKKTVKATPPSFKQVLSYFYSKTPNWIKSMSVFQKLVLLVKKKYRKSSNSQGAEQPKVCLDRILESYSVIPFSELAKNPVLKNYFKKVEENIDNKNLTQLAGVGERYLCMVLYIQERVRNCKLIE